MSSFSDSLIATYGEDYLEGDLALTAGLQGDLATTDLGDLATLNWAENVRVSVLRRLNTPMGAIASSVLGTEGLLILNEGYGNPALGLLSEPLSPSLLLRVRDRIIVCLDQEDRIDVLEVTPRLEADTNGRRMVIDVSYAIKDTPGQQLLTIGANQQAGVFEEV